MLGSAAGTRNRGPKHGHHLVRIWSYNQYLIETYDKENELSFATTPEKHLLDEWLFFQASGQGPYFGRALWFSYFHKEQLPSAKERYYGEIKRITKVLDRALEEKEYLVSNKCTFAGLAFVPWYWGVAAMGGAKPGLYAEVLSENPNFKAWLERLSARASVEKAVAARAEASAKK
ncbi:hypothetical protein G7Y89_g3107 [Cudoniella acicularis]|uniref:glutathione transferase n=1 Tax=Cudoniella acicularis TaxID=354080 RepID=A0A8H4RSU7_9HELO|nr:hypothetical protein G7Y89_g3107 [Cudoniella acicularis]